MSHLDNPMLWAVIIGWIFTVVLHEFAHGIVGFFGGDYTLRQRGGLSLNPIYYIDPLFSIIMPVVFLLIGGVPLPGGSTYIRRDLLRSRHWDSAVSLAGPTVNFLLFILLALPFHPIIGWIHPSRNPDTWTNPQVFLGALALLQMVAVVINLIPVPPLDGFGVIAPYLDPQLRRQLTTPPVSTGLFFFLFFVIWRIPGLYSFIYRTADNILLFLRFDHRTISFIARSFNYCLFGSY